MIKIKLAVLGHLPYLIDISKIIKWKSCLFEIEREVGKYPITTDSDGPDWSYSDSNLVSIIPQRNSEDILIVITNVPLEGNYFARRFSDNRVCLTYYEMVDILTIYNISLENLILRVLYSISILYKRYRNRIPTRHEPTNFAHDETRGCLYDMCGIKTDIIHSLNKPQLCDDYVHDITHNENPRIDRSIIDKVQIELKKIHKERYYQILDFVKRRPVFTLILSTIITIVLGAVGSVLATILLEYWR